MFNTVLLPLGNCTHPIQAHAMLNIISFDKSRLNAKSAKCLYSRICFQKQISAKGNRNSETE